MDPTHIYSLIAGNVLLSIVFYRMFHYISLWIQNQTIFYIFKYLIYPTVYRRRRFLSPITRLRFLLTLFYWIATAACNIIGVKSISEAGKRAATISIIHFVPLLLTDHSSFGANLLGLSLKNYSKLHGSLGLMAIIQSLIHVLTYITRNTFQIQDSLHFFGFLVQISFILFI